MSGLAPITVTPVDQLDPWETVRQAIAYMPDRIRELEEAGDTRWLASGLADLRTLLADLKVVERDAEDALARVMPTKTEVVDGIGTLERKRAGRWKDWHSDALIEEVVTSAVDKDTGELSVVAVLDALRECVPFTPSLGWRTTALKERGIDPDEFGTYDKGRLTVRVTK